MERALGERRGRPELNVQKSAQFSGDKTRELAAQKSGFGSHYTYERAQAIVDSGDDSLIKAVDESRVSINAAADVATLPNPEQAEIVARGEREILQAAKQIRTQRSEERRAEVARLRLEAWPAYRNGAMRTIGVCSKVISRRDSVKPL